MALAPDPSDKLDAAADGAFGGKPVNRRAGYGDRLAMALKFARKGACLSAGEGQLIVEHYEERLDELQRTLSDQIVIANQMDDRIMAQYEEMTRLAQIIGRLREPSDEVVDAASVWLPECSTTKSSIHTRAVIRTAVEAAEKEASA